MSQEKRASRKKSNPLRPIHLNVRTQGRPTLARLEDLTGQMLLEMLLLLKGGVASLQE
jgi:hypothetical protein